MKIVIARSWREFQQRQGAAVRSLHQIFSNKDVHLHICVNGDIDWQLVDDLRIMMPNWKINIYANKFLNDYARKRGATEQQISEFSKWPGIYNILLYYYLWHVLREEYVLTYDDDILFDGFPKEVMYKIQSHIPFSTADTRADSDKPLMGKLVMKFGNWIHDEYYSCSDSDLASNSSFMGVINREIFEQFSSPDTFREMLDLFEYREVQGADSAEWNDYKVLLQEQSFLGVLNRAFSRKRHEVLDLTDWINYTK